MRSTSASRLTSWRQTPASSRKSELEGSCRWNGDTPRPLLLDVCCVLLHRYGSLVSRRRPFVEKLSTYGNALILLPAFSYSLNTPLSMRVLYTVQDFQSPTRPIFFNPEYLKNLTLFWRTQGLKPIRLSTGLMMASIALEACADVHLYGFWPFSNHPLGLYTLTNHYYDDRKPKPKFHAMPAEFDLLLKLHEQGVLKLHLGDCRPERK